VKEVNTRQNNLCRGFLGGRSSRAKHSMWRRGGESRLNATFKLLQTLTSCTGSPAYAAERDGDIRYSPADISAAQQHLGYEPK
jgi:hypothetical protein